MAAVLLALLIAVSARAQSPAPPAPPAADTENFEKKPLRRSEAKSGAASRPTTQKASAAKTTSGASGGFDVRRVVTALAIVVALILLFRWLARRLFGVAVPGRSTRAVQVLSRSPLSPKQQLVLLRVGRRLIVVAEGGGQMNTLSEITDADEVAALVGQLQDDHAARASKSFGSLFGRMRGKYEPDPDAAAGSEQESLAPAGAPGQDEDRDDAAVASTRQELSGLMDKVRLLSRQFKT